MESIDDAVTITIDGHTYEEVTFKVALYDNTASGDMRTAIALIDSDGTLLARATVNLMQADPYPGCVFIKNWGENEGMLEELERLGIGEKTGRSEPSGFVTVPEFRLLGAWAAVIMRLEGRS